jgi:excisionase family DNA binding protein
VKYLTVSEAANVLGLSAQTVRDIPSNMLSHSRTYGGQRRYKREDLELYMKSREVFASTRTNENAGISLIKSHDNYAFVELRYGNIVLTLPTIQLWMKAAATITEITEVLDIDINGYITVMTNDGEEYIDPYGVAEFLGIPEFAVQAEMAKVKGVYLR